jgi:hypothetical protein
MSGAITPLSPVCLNGVLLCIAGVQHVACWTFNKGAVKVCTRGYVNIKEYRTS